MDGHVGLETLSSHRAREPSVGGTGATSRSCRSSGRDSRNGLASQESPGDSFEDSPEDPHLVYACGSPGYTDSPEDEVGGSQQEVAQPVKADALVEVLEEVSPRSRSSQEDRSTQTESVRELERRLSFSSDGAACAMTARCDDADDVPCSAEVSSGDNQRSGAAACQEDGAAPQPSRPRTPPPGVCSMSHRSLPKVLGCPHDHGPPTHPHPIFDGAQFSICRECHGKLEEEAVQGAWKLETGEGGRMEDMYCRFCGEGGDIVHCDVMECRHATGVDLCRGPSHGLPEGAGGCPFAFCTSCLARSFRLVGDAPEFWRCPICVAEGCGLSGSDAAGREGEACGEGDGDGEGPGAETAGAGGGGGGSPGPGPAGRRGGLQAEGLQAEYLTVLRDQSLGRRAAGHKRGRSVGTSTGGDGGNSDSEAGAGAGAGRKQRRGGGGGNDSDSDSDFEATLKKSRRDDDYNEDEGEDDDSDEDEDEDEDGDGEMVVSMTQDEERVKREVDGIVAERLVNFCFNSGGHFVFDPTLLPPPAKPTLKGTRTPFFLYEQVLKTMQSYARLAPHFLENGLKEERMLALDAWPLFSTASRLRQFATNIRGHQSLKQYKEEHGVADSVVTFLAKKMTGGDEEELLRLAPWLEHVYKDGHFNTISTQEHTQHKHVQEINQYKFLVENARGAGGGWVPTGKQVTFNSKIDGCEQEPLLTYKNGDPRKAGGKGGERKMALYIKKMPLIPGSAVYGRSVLQKLTPEMADALMGFPEGHTKGSGDFSTTMRRKMIGNSFSVPVVKYILSPLKGMQDSGELPRNGINVLSCFDGCGALIVALNELGVKVRTLWTSEIVAEAVDVVATYMRFQMPDTVHVELGDICKIAESNAEHVAMLAKEHGVHLVAGGSPCNNMKGTNNRQRAENKNGNGDSELLGAKSGLYFRFAEIVERLRHVYWTEGEGRWFDGDPVLLRGEDAGGQPFPRAAKREGG